MSREDKVREAGRGDGATEAFTSGKPPTSPRPQSASPKLLVPGIMAENGRGETRHISKRCAIYAGCRSRIRSSSAGRNPQNDLRARYWAFLFENLHRAVDEIYQTCEMDESVVECKEAIMMLENYSKEFRSLIQWLNLNKDFENTLPPNRPTSLAWEVRKSSPGKGILRNVFLDKYSSKEITKKSKSPCLRSTSVQTDVDVNGSNKSEEKTNFKDVVLDFGLGEKPCFADMDLIHNNEIIENKLINCEKKGSIPIIQGNLNEKPVSLDVKESLFSSVTVKPAKIENDISIINKENIIQNNLISKSIENVVSVCESLASADETKNNYPDNKNLLLLSKEDNMHKTDSKQNVLNTAEKFENIQSKGNEKKDQSVSNTFHVTSGRTMNSEKTIFNVSVPEKTTGKVTGNKGISSPQGIVPTSIGTVQKNIRTSPTNIDNKRKSDTIVKNKKCETGKLQDTKTKIGINSLLVQSNKKADISSGNTQPSGKLLIKNENLNSSSSSLSSTSSGKSWADKVKGSLQELNIPITKFTEEKNKDEDDSDGWETVRIKNRSKNFLSKKVSQPLQAKSYPDIHKKQAKEQYGSMQSLKSTKRFVKTSNSITDVNNQQMKRKVSNIKGEPLKNNNNNSKSCWRKGNLFTNTRDTNGKKTEGNRQTNSLKTDKNSKFTLCRSKTDIKENFKTSREKTNLAIKLSNTNAKKSKSEILLLNVNKSEAYAEKDKNNLKNYLLSMHDKKEENINVKNVEDEKIQNTFEKNESKSSETFRKIEIEISSDLSDSDTSNNFDNNIDSLNFNLSLNKTKKDGVVEQDSDEDLQIGYEQEVTVQEGINASENVEWDETAAREEAQERISKLGLSWGDQMDHLDMELRPPGRALQMHEKLSSPYRKRSLSESIRRHEEKQLKAQEKREKLLEEKTQRFKDIAKKVEEMKAWKEEQQQQRRISMEKKLRRAEEKRRMQLQRIVRKAHDEEEKVNEIAFINTLEAQNKRHDILSKKKDHEARLQDIQEERQRKLEEKAAKEAAAEERRKALEAKRQTRLLEMQERRKLRDLKIEQQLQEKEKERQELANQKARDREQRLSALNAAQQATLEELQKKIQQKQEESARRHEENIELIRQKAFELSVRHYSSNDDDVPRLVPYETKKMCTVCNVLIVSEVYLLSHLRGKKHKEVINLQHQGKDPSTEELESYNLKHIVDAPADKLDPNIALDKERQKALKKRCKKLRQRMTNRGLEYEASSANRPVSANSIHKQKMQKIIKDINKLINNQGKGPWDTTIASNLERSLGELERLIGKCSTDDKIVCYNLGGINALMKILSVISNVTVSKNLVIPKKTIARAATVFGLICSDCPENCYSVLFSNKIGILLDYLIHCLNLLIPDNYTQLLNSNPNSVNRALPTDILSGNLMQLLAVIIITWFLCKQMNFAGIQNLFIDQNKIVSQNEEFQQRVHDVIR
ncbi:S phase cyclin A-associated protein in the endoplasmic reticulum isoform X2 [Centruroides vittatus]|uniref:S phase cyclin A-associated protein in the endoplasmic reticulum isoform X2 n=1 Tax=Centruroides vittatus TaxID=120091 RepID=UPI00350EB1E7